MILCRYKTDVGGREVVACGVCPTQKDIGWQDERPGRVKNSYVIISDGSYVSEGSLSEVVTKPPHNLDTIHGPVAGYTYTNKLSR